MDRGRLFLRPKLITENKYNSPPHTNKSKEIQPENRVFSHVYTPSARRQSSFDVAVFAYRSFPQTIVFKRFETNTIYLNNCSIDVQIFAIRPYATRGAFIR